MSTLQVVAGDWPSLSDYSFKKAIKILLFMDPKFLDCIWGCKVGARWKISVIGLVITF